MRRNIRACFRACSWLVWIGSMGLAVGCSGRGQGHAEAGIPAAEGGVSPQDGTRAIEASTVSLDLSGDGASATEASAVSPDVPGDVARSSDAFGAIDAEVARSNDDARDAAAGQDGPPTGADAADVPASHDGAALSPDADVTAKSDLAKTEAASSAEGGQLCTGEYNACGCACCDGRPAGLRCYYPSLGESLSPIVAADVASTVGVTCGPGICSTGLRYVCCMSAQPEASGATYAATSTIGDYLRVGIYKSGDDGRCASLFLLQPATTSASVFPLALPSRWGLGSGAAGACADGGALNPAFGALGTVAWSKSGTACLVYVHVTLFVGNSAGGMDSVRLDADGITLSGATPADCR